MKPLTIAQIEARAHAYNEAAGHLELAWTDDPIEREQGNVLIGLFYREAERQFARAARREASLKRREGHNP